MGRINAQTHPLEPKSIPQDVLLWLRGNPDSWLCQDGQGPWVKDFNGDGNSYQSNTNGVSSAGGGGSGPWFQCEITVTIQNGDGCRNQWNSKP